MGRTRRLRRWPYSIFSGAAKTRSLSGNREPAKLPVTIPVPVYQFNPLTPEQRAAIFLAYRSQEDITAALPLCESFRTAYELSLAAEVLGEIPDRPHRASLLDAYVRRQCDQT